MSPTQLPSAAPVTQSAVTQSAVTQSATFASGPALTLHAATRSRQRGIRSDTIDLIFEYADRECFVGSGLLHVFVSRSRIRKLLDDGVSPAMCAQLDSTSLLLDPDSNAVVTALRGGADARGIKRYRRGQYSWTNSKTTH